MAALLVLGTAMPSFVLGSSGFGRIMGGGKRPVVIVWDDSYSMAYNAGKTSHFDRSKKLILDYLANAPASDAVAIVRASSGAEPLVGKPWTVMRNLRAAVEGHPGQRRRDRPGAGADESRRHIEGYGKDDQGAHGRPAHGPQPEQPAHGSRGDAGREQLKRAAAAVKEVAALQVVDVGEADQPNKGIVELKTAQARGRRGRSDELEVVAQNRTMWPRWTCPSTCWWTA